MFGKFHRYNTRNREYIQSVGNDDLIVVKTAAQKIGITNRNDNSRPRQDPETLVLNGLRGWWRLDEGSDSTVNDTSGYDNHAIIPAGVTWTEGYLGRTILSTNPAANRISLDSYVTNFQFMSQNSFSVSMWFRFTNNLNDIQPLLTIREDDTTSKHFHILKRNSDNLNKITFAFNAAGDLNSATQITDNRWYHFAGTYNYDSGTGTGTRIIYINGVQDAIDPSPVNPLNFTPTSMSIGYSNFTNTCLDGSINDMRIYDRVLSPSEVSNIYNLGSDDISKTIASNVATTSRNTSSLIYKEIGLVNSLGLTNSTGTGISAQSPTRSENLVGWWPLNEGTGDYAFDRAGKNLTASAVGGTITWANDNYIGPSFINSADRYFQTANVIPSTGMGITNQYTICCWAKSTQDTWNDYGCLINHRVTDGVSSFNLYPDQGTKTVSLITSYSLGLETNVVSDIIPDITVWNHYAGIYDGSTIRMWVNGIPSGAVTTINTLVVYDSQIRIGRDNVTASRYLNGSIADCRIYNTALNQQELLTIMQERRPLDAPRDISKNTAIWWQLNEGNGSVLPDYSGNNRTLTLINSPTWVYNGPNSSRCLKFENVMSQCGNTVTTYTPSDLGIINKLTVSAWIKSTQSTWNIDGAGITQRADDASSFTFLLHPYAGLTDFSFYVTNTTSVFAEAKITSSYDITQWHHYLGTYNGSYVKIYLDGNLINATSFTGNIINNSLPIRVGADYHPRFLNAEISDVRIYNTDLTDLEITNLYRETIGNYSPIHIPATKNNGIIVDNKPELLLQLTGANFSNSSYVPDYSGYQHNGNIIIASGVTYSAISPIIGTRSLLFNGTTGYLVCDGFPNGQPFKGTGGINPRSVSMWVKPDSLAANRPLVSFGANANRSFYDLFIDTTGNVNLSLDNSNSSYIYKWNTQLTTGTWQHITIAQESDGTLACTKGTSTVAPSTANLVSITDGLDTSNLQVWIPMTDGQGTIAYDYSSNTTTSNGTLVNATYTGIDSKFATSVLNFDGTTSYVTTNYLPNIAQPFSFTMWINTSKALADYGPLISVSNNDGQGDNDEFVLQIDSGTNKLAAGQIGRFGQAGEDGPVITPNVWTHVAFVYNGSSVYNIYLNGSNAFARNTGTPTVAAPSGSFLTFGRFGYAQPGTAFVYYKGSMVDFRSYNTALSANSIVAIYNNSNRINTITTSNLQIGRGVQGSPYVSNYYSGYMDDIRFYAGTLRASDVNNIYAGGYSLANSGIVLPGIPISRNDIYGTYGSGGSSSPLQAPAYLLSTGFNTAFTNKTITFIPASSTTYTYQTTATTGTWPPESVATHTKVTTFSGTDDAVVTLPTLINNFVYYGTARTYFSVSTNGNFSVEITNDTSYSETYPVHYNKRRISMFFDDLQVIAAETPFGVYYGYKSEDATNDVYIITYYGIANLSNTSSRNSCQVKLYLNNSPYSGRIVMIYGTVQTTNALAGISNGTTPSDSSQGTNISTINSTTVNFPSQRFVYNYAQGNQNNAYLYNGLTTTDNSDYYHLKNGLVGWWKLNESSGNTYFDTSSSLINGTFTGSSQSSNINIGPYNFNTLNLEGSSYLNVYNTNFPVTGTNLSYSAWFKTSNISSNNTIFGLQSSSVGNLRLPVMINSQGNVVVYNNLTAIDSNTYIPINSWNHVVVTATNNDPTANIRIYINSQLITTSTTSAIFANTDRLFIGALSRSGGFADYFYGQLSDIRLYNRKITDNEIKLLYNSSTGLNTRTYSGTYALDLFGSNVSATDYSRWIEQTGTVNSNTLSIACWIEPLYLGTHTISSSKSTGTRGNGDWQFQLVSPGYDALKGWWLLNEGTGTTSYDCGPSFYHAAISGTASWLDAPKSIKSLLFNGTNTYVQLDTGTGTGLASVLAGSVCSVSAWFYSTYIVSNQTIFSINNNATTTNNLVVFLSSGVLSLISGGTTVSTSRTVSTNMWNFVCVVGNGTSYSIYHNSGDSFFSTTTTALSIASNDKISVGARLPSTMENFTGMITDVRVWNRVLASSEVADIFMGNQYLYGSIRIAGTNYPIYDTRPIELETWRHVGFQYTSSPGEIKLFLDGQITKKDTLNVGNQAANMTSNTVIGALSASGRLNQYSLARISDYRQYNTIIPESEYYKYATGYYEQAFKLDITPPINTSNLASGLVDAGTKLMGKESSALIQVNGEPRIQQMTSNITCDNGYELYFDGQNDYLSLPNSYLQASYNRAYSITGWVKPDSVLVNGTGSSLSGNSGFIGGAVLNNSLYLFGGYDGSIVISTIRHFDGNTWMTDANNIGIAKREISAVTHNGNIYLIGGADAATTTLYNTFQKYDGFTVTTYSGGSVFPIAVRSGSAISYKGKLYHFGGLNNTATRINTIYVFNDSTITWSAMTVTMNTVRAGHTTVIYNDLVYIIGGESSSGGLNTVEVFNGNSCRYVGNMPNYQSYHTSMVMNGYIYNFGGYYGILAPSSSVLRFDGQTWTVLSITLSTPRNFSAGGIVNNKYYIAGGYTGSVYLSSVESFKFSGSIFSKATNNLSCYNLSWENMSNTFVFDMGIGNEKIFISANSVPASYSHLAIVNTGPDGFLGMYINGSLQASTYLSSHFFKGLHNVSTSIIPMIGRKQDDEGSYFQGAITDLRFWEKPLTQPEITNLIRPLQTTLQISNQVSAATKYPELNQGLIFWLSGEEIRTANGNKIIEKSDYKRRCVISSVTTGAGRLSSTASMYFNGSAQISIPPSSFYALKQSALTVSFWVKFGSSSIPASNEFIFYLWGAATANNYFEILRATTTGELRGTFNDSGDTTNTLKITDTNWHHYVITYNGGISTGTRYQYLDGNIYATGAAKTSLTFSTLPSVALIGTNGATSFTGFLEDFRVYNRALSIDEIRYLYNSTYNSTNYKLATQEIPYSNKTYLTKLTYNNKGHVINVPMPEIARDNLICHYDFRELDSNSNVKDINWKSKPLANYRNSSYLTNKSTITIPYNPGQLNGGATVTDSGLSLSQTSNLTLTPVFDDGSDWSLSFQIQTTNSLANVNLWSYTATASSTNNKLLFVNSSNGGEVVFRHGATTEYNTGIYVTDDKSVYVGVTKGTIGNQTDVVSFYQNGLLTGRQNITLTKDGPSLITLGPFNGLIQDYRMYSTQLNATQLNILSSQTNDTNTGLGTACGPKHMWRFDESNTATTIIRDMGTEGTNLILTNAIIRTKAGDLNASNSAVSIGSLFFDGSTSYAQAFSPGILRDNTRTIMFWMKLSSSTAPGSDQKLFNYGDFTTTASGFSINRESATSKISVSIWNLGGKVSSTISINNTSWNHIAVVLLPKENSVSGSIGTMFNLLIYINGVDSTDTSTWNVGLINTVKTTSAGDEWITIGRKSDAASNYFGGFMDDIRVYDVALTPQEIRGIYSNSTNYNFVS